MAKPISGTVFVDTETRSSKSLKAGLWDYASHCEITTAAIAIGDGTVKSLDEKQFLVLLDEIRKKAGDNPYRVVAHNVAFDRAVIEWRARRLGVVGKWDGPLVRPDAWCCTQLMARSLNLPAALKDLALHLWPHDEGKDMEGHALVADESGPGLFEADAQKVAEYCRKDVDLTRKVYGALLSHVSEIDIALAPVDSSINLRGLPIDRELCETRMADIEAERLELHDWAKRTYPEVFTSNNWSLGQVSKVDGLVDWLQQKRMDSDAKELQAKRDRYGSLVNALGKWKAGAKAIDGRARNCFVPRSTQSGRWAGKGIQPQNLKRATGDDKLDTRAMVKAPSGCKLVVADFSQIELRLALWMAGLQDELSSIEAGDDFYSRCAEMAFGESNKERRFLMKGTILGLQYGIGKQKAINSMVASGASDDDANKVWGWLSKTMLPSYRKCWSKMEQAAKGRIGTKFADERDSHSFAVLPHWDRKVVWHGMDPDMGSYLENKKGSFVKGKWWPGNGWAHVVSGLAADIMASTVIGVDREFRDRELRAKIVGTVHDEILVESPDSEVDDVRGILSSVMAGAFKPVMMKAEIGVSQDWLGAK